MNAMQMTRNLQYLNAQAESNTVWFNVVYETLREHAAIIDTNKIRSMKLEKLATKTRHDLQAVVGKLSRTTQR